MSVARDTSTRVGAQGDESRTGLAALCATQVTSWGVLYYAFPVLAGDITAATGWSTPAITGALSVSQLIAALVGIQVGRRLDRHGPRGVMTAGSLLAVPAVVLVATAQNVVWFYLAWVLVGTAAALATHLDWRQTYLVLAVILAVPTAIRGTSRVPDHSSCWP